MMPLRRSLRRLADSIQKAGPPPAALRWKFGTIAAYTAGDTFASVTVDYDTIDAPFLGAPPTVGELVGVLLVDGASPMILSGASSKTTGGPSPTLYGLPPGGDPDDVLTKVDGTDYNTEWAPPSPSGAPVDVQLFTANGVWTMPVGAQIVDVVVIGGGAGGGAGQRGAAGGVRFGGGGGGAGALSFWRFRAVDLGSTVNVAVGAGGTGGAAQTVDSSNGASGTSGSRSTFGASPGPVYLVAGAGQLGTGGFSGLGGPGGAAGTPGTDAGSAGASAAAGGAAGATPVSVSSTRAPSGGGSGAGISSSNVFSSGGSGGWLQVLGERQATHGAAGPSNGVTGAGGGGGNSSNTAAGEAGGAGGNFGAGGGGGAASLNGFNSGAGGAGAPGCVLVTTYF